MITTINNKHKKLNFSSEREQSQACLNSAEHEKNQGRKVLNVPNLRFKEFQGEWEKTKFGDIAVVVGGGTPDTNTSQYWNGKIQWFTPSEIGRNKYVYNSVRTISEEGLNKSSAKLLPTGTILLSSRATVGECSINKKECTTNQGFQSLIPKENISNEFVYYLIQTKRKDLIRKSCGSTFLEISANEVRKIVVSIPTIKEQDKIAKLLSLLDERIATQNKIIDKLQSLIRGIRNDVFGKFRKSVGVNAMVGEVLSYEQPQPYIVEDTEYTAEGIPVLTANKAFVLGYTSETDGIYDKGDCIIFDDFTLDCKYVDFPFKVKSSAIKILTAKDKELLRYTFEFMKYLDLSTDEHKRHYIAETQNQELFLPTAQVVRTIAHAFSALSSRMKTVTKQRDLFELQKQYLLRQMFI